MHLVRFCLLVEVHEVHIYDLYLLSVDVIVQMGLGKVQHMLADVFIGRSTYGGDRNRDDLHRHATFSCGLRAMFRRMLRMFHPA